MSAAGLVGLEALAYAIVLPHLPLVVGEQEAWWTVGFLFAGYSIAQFMAIGPIGRLAERFGVRPVVAACLAGTAVGLVMTALSSNYWVLLAARIIDGASAGTIVVVTAATLSWFSRPRWTSVLGGLGATRGAAALVGISITAAAGIALGDPRRGLSIMAWIGTGLVLVALAMVPVLRTRHTWAVDGRRQPITRAVRPALVAHVAAQGAIAGLVLLAPAAASTVASLGTGFAAPAAAIVGLAVGQTVFAARVDRHPAVLAAMIAALVAGVAAIPFSRSVLAGFVLAGIAIGSYAPRAQAALIEWRIAGGETDVGANAFAGRGSIVGQIAGPMVGYVALTRSTALAAAAVAVFGLVGSRVRRPGSLL